MKRYIRPDLYPTSYHNISKHYDFIIYCYIFEKGLKEEVKEI